MLIHEGKAGRIILRLPDVFAILAQGPAEGFAVQSGCTVAIATFACAVARGGSSLQQLLCCFCGPKTFW